MSTFSEIWEDIVDLGQGIWDEVVNLGQTIFDVIVDIIFTVVDIIFSLAIFFNWLDEFIDSLIFDGLSDDMEEAILLPVDDCQPILDKYKRNNQIVVGPVYNRGQRATIGCVADSDGKIIRAQIIQPDKEKGFDSSISGAINHGRVFASKIKSK